MKNNTKKLMIAIGFVSLFSGLSAQKYRIDSLVIKNGSQGAGKVLISDANGNATWGTAITNTSDSTTASNGLTLSGKDVRLGGTLSSATTVTLGANDLTFTGSGLINKLSGSASSNSFMQIGRTSGELQMGVAGLTAQGFAATAIGDAWISNINNLFVGTQLAKSLNLVTNNSIRGTFDINGNFGIGTTSPAGLLNLVNNGNGGAAADDILLESYNVGTSSPAIAIGSSRGTYTAPSNLQNGDIMGAYHIGGRWNGTSNFFNTSTISSFYKGNGTTSLTDMRFFTSTAERMRIDENGNVGIGLTNPSIKLQVTSSGNYTGAFYSTAPDPDGIVYIEAPATNSTGSYLNTEFIMFSRTGFGSVGNVSFTSGGTSVAYNTTSDIRLKEDFRVCKLGISDLMKIKVTDYHRKNTEKNSREIGFLAQQLHTIFPDAVTPGSSEDLSKPWMVDYGRMTPLLVKAIQDQQAQIEELKKEIIELKSRK